MADIEGDENDNTINGTSGSDNIKGKGGQDNLNGGGGNDTVSGGAGNDDIDGGSGNDIIYGGDGDDTITGGSGDDIIIGGRGDDTMSAGSGSRTDTYVIRDGDGNDTITDFDPGEPDIIMFDMVEMSSYQDVLDRISTDGNDTIITYDNGSTTRLLNTNPNNLSATNFQYGSGPVCLSQGTYIETPSGPRRIETLQRGDLVTTLDHGAQPVIGVTAETVIFKGGHDKRKPILIGKGALGQRLPEQDIEASPQHRFLVHCPKRREGFLVAAVKLTKRKGIRRMNGRKSATYYNLLMGNHEIVLANGCAVETLLVTPSTVLKLRALNVPLEIDLPMMRPARAIASSDPKFDAAPQVGPCRKRQSGAKRRAAERAEV